MPDPPEPHARERATRVGTRYLGILAIFSALFSLSFAGYAAWDQDWTTDEHIHLAWSERFWNSGELERDSAGRYASTTPIHAPNAALRQFVERRGVEQEKAVRFAARVPQLAWLVVMFFACYGLGGRLGGSAAAGTAVGLAALDPNLIAHASVVTTDIPFAASTALALWAALAQRQEPSRRRAGVLGAGVALALAAKFSAVLLAPLALGAAFLKRGGTAGRIGSQLAVCLLSAWFVLAGAYGFKGVFAPLESSAWRSSVFQNLAAGAPRLRTPLPRSFLEGVDRSRARDAAEHPVVVILGRVSPEPVWYYFVAAWSLKTPIALMLVSLAFLPRLLASARRLAEVAWLVGHQATALLFFSLLFQTQLGYRYTLMLIPVTCALVAKAATDALGRRGLTALMALVTVASLAETTRFWGDPLAFSNALVQPKKKAYLFLGNADIDWNQNQDRWLEFRKSQRLPDNGALNPVDLVEGLNVISTSRLAGVFPGDRFKWARENLEPRAMAGWTHHYFDVTRPQYDRFLEEARRLRPTPEAPRFCGLSATGSMDAPGIETTFETTSAPPGRRVTVLCVATRRGTDLAARVNPGGRFELIPAARPDLGTYLTPGANVQFRLDPGVHSFAIVETPYRRAFLPYHLSAVFQATQHGAVLKIIHPKPTDLPPSLAALTGAAGEP